MVKSLQLVKKKSFKKASKSTDVIWRIGDKDQAPDDDGDVKIFSEPRNLKRVERQMFGKAWWAKLKPCLKAVQAPKAFMKLLYFILMCPMLDVRQVIGHVEVLMCKPSLSLSLAQGVVRSQ